MITKWLRDSGLVVNDDKTEICLFFKRDHAPINLTINNKILTSQHTINVLGVLFDCKLAWTSQVAQTIKKSRKALQAIRLIKKYLTKKETKQLLTSNFYSILYYNCEIWLMPSISPRLKQQLLSASANALRLLNNISDLRLSFDQLHNIHKRANPTKMMQYRLSIQLYKIYNATTVDEDWVDLNVQQSFNARTNTLHINDYSNLKVGKNIMMNRLGLLNFQIDLDLFNTSLNTFKIKMKRLFME